MSFPFEIPKGRLLYHPCCGDDLAVPLALYADFVDVFVFVEAIRVPRWIRENHQGRHDSRDTLRQHGYRHVGNVVIGDRNLRPRIPSIEVPGSSQSMLDPAALEANSCTVQDTFQSREGRTITVFRKRGCGLTTLEQLDGIDVFYYTGDSPGESGSNLPLMKQPDFYWLQKMRAGGLVVTDGSNADSIGFGKWLDEQEEAWIDRSGEHFSKWGRTFTCLRKAGHRYGPVLEWQIDLGES